MDFFRGVPEIGITTQKVIHVLLDIVVHIHVRHLPMGLKQKTTLLIEHRFRTKSNHFVNKFRKKCLKRERRVVDTVDTPYSYYICPFQVKKFLVTHLNNFFRTAHEENRTAERSEAILP